LVTSKFFLKQKRVEFYSTRFNFLLDSLLNTNNTKMYYNETLKFKVLMDLEKNKLNKLWYWTTGVLLMAIVVLIILLVISN